MINTPQTWPAAPPPPAPPTSGNATFVAPQNPIQVRPEILFYATRPANKRRILALTIDLTVVIVTLTAGLAIGWWPATIAAVALATVIVVDLRHHGRSPGHRLLGLRTVGRTSGLPAGLATFTTGAISLDIRTGRDPLRVLPAAAMQIAPSPAPDPWAATAAWLSELMPVALLTSEGSILPIREPTIVGRAPEQTGGLPALGIPDMARTVSRNHLRVEPEGPNGLWVTDLGSVNGTTAIGRQVTRLHPHVPFAASIGCELYLGQQKLQVVRAGRHPEDIA